MKDKLFLIVLFVFSLSIGVKAQSPDLINYQAVARDLSGNPLVSSAVNITYDIRQSTAIGTVVYSETHNLTTNQFGLFTAQIGGGTPVTGTFAGINWSTGLYYLQVTVNGDVMTATQLLSVPYALHANTATSGIPGANGHNGLSANTIEPAGVNCPNGGYLVDVGVDDNDNGILEAVEIDFSYYVCNGADGAANVNDTSATNELQTISLSNDTVFLSSGGFIKLPPALGDNWGSQVVVSTGANISGDGTSGNPLAVFDNDTSATNEIELPLTATTNDVLTWNGSSWVAQVAPLGADNWGTQVVVSTGTNISGDGTTGNPLSVSDNDPSATNELQNLSITGNNLNISSGTGTQISPINPNTGDLLYWNGLNWVAQSVAGNTDNQNLLNGGKIGNNQIINIQNGTGIAFSVADGDSSNFNEYNTSFGVNGPNLELVDGGNTFQVALSNLADNDWITTGLNIRNANAGNVGIGVITPTRKFEVQDNSTAFATYIQQGSASGDGLSVYSNTSATTRTLFNAVGNSGGMHVKGNGHVGIGTATPNSSLDVQGHITMQDGNQQPGYIPVSNTAGLMTWTDPATIALGSSWLVNGTDIYNGNSGQVGIGTSTPSFPLEVRTTTNVRGAYVEVSGANSSTGSKIGVTGISTGGLGTGDNIGGSFNAIGGSSGDNIGVEGISTTGTAANIGVKGWTTAGTGNWAGFFGGAGVGTGNVHIQDNLRVGSTANGTQSAHVFINNLSTSSNNSSIEILNQYNGASTTYGIYNRLTPGGTGGVYGIWNYITPSAASNSAVFGFRNLIQSNGNGIRYGVYSLISANGTGIAYGTYNVLNHSGSGDIYGFRLDATGSSTSGNSYGLYISGPLAMENYIGGNTGIGVINPVNRLDVEGAAVIGATYSGTNTAPTNGLLVAGNVGIGTTGPNSKLHVNETGTNPLFRAQLNGSTQFMVANNGYVALYANNAPAYKLQLNVNSAAKPTSSAWTIASDRRLKKDIKPFAGGLSDVLKINPVWFTYNGKAGMPNETGVGIIAQELKEIAPYMVNEWKYTETNEETGESEGPTEKYLGVDNGAMTYMLINAIKEQQKMIEDLKLEVEELKKK